MFFSAGLSEVFLCDGLREVFFAAGLTEVFFTELESTLCDVEAFAVLAAANAGTEHTDASIARLKTADRNFFISQTSFTINWEKLALIINLK